MGLSEWLSVAAVVIAGASAFFTKRQADSSREALELQKAVRFSIEWLREIDTLRIRNEANSPAYLDDVEVSRRMVTWREPYHGTRIDPTATLDVVILPREFSPAPGDSVVLRYGGGRRSKNLEWSDIIR